MADLDADSKLYSVMSFVCCKLLHIHNRGYVHSSMHSRMSCTADCTVAIDTKEALHPFLAM